MNKKYTLALAFLIVLLLGTLGVFKHRWDLTQEKRYTLSDVTQNVLKKVDQPMKFSVYLEGDFPASFKQLQGETKFMLEEFRRLNPKIDFEFIDPIKNKIPQDSLQKMGIEPSVLPQITEGKTEQLVIFPYAVITYDGYGTSVPLIIEQTGISSDEQLNKSIENLEYAFVSKIKTLTTKNIPNVGVLINHDELRPEEFQGFMQMALESYNAGPVIPKNQKELSLEDLEQLNAMDALVIAKPRKEITDQEKLILDQYIMKGGKALWMIDAVNAEMDTLYRSEKIMAYPVKNNLTDFFFNYGVRITPGLVKDFKKSALIKLVTGEIAGNPQYSTFLWPYFPLGISSEDNPLTRNINPVKFSFPTALDTLGRPGIKTTVLYESSERTTVKPVPNYIDLSEVVTSDSLAMNEKPSLPKIFAVSLEGKFTSAYANRSDRADYPNFKSKSEPNKMIIISDGDVGRNEVVKGKPLPLGIDVLTKQQYGNKQFLKNALDYLLDDDNLISLRNRNIEARLLDRRRINEDRSYWQFFNLLFPLAVLAFVGSIMIYWRRKQFK